MEGEDLRVTSAELLTELLLAKRDSTKPMGALRTTEIKDRLGWSMENVRRFLLELKEEGIIEVVKVRIMTLDDKAQPTPHYRIKDGAEVEELVERMIEQRNGDRSGEA